MLIHVCYLINLCCYLYFLSLIWNASSSTHYKSVHIHLHLYYLLIFVYTLAFIHLLYSCCLELFGVVSWLGFIGWSQAASCIPPALQACSPALWEGCVGGVAVAPARYQPVLVHPQPHRRQDPKQSWADPIPGPCMWSHPLRLQTRRPLLSIPQGTVRCRILGHGRWASWHSPTGLLPLLLSPGPILGHHQQEAEEAFEASQGSEVSSWTSEEWGQEGGTKGWHQGWHWHSPSFASCPWVSVELESSPWGFWLGVHSGPHTHVSHPRCCENCGISFSGDGTRRQRLKTLCKDCRGEWPLGHWEVELEQPRCQAGIQISGWGLSGRWQSRGSREVRYLMLL